jgi:hypothetical protein
MDRIIREQPVPEALQITLGAFKTEKDSADADMKRMMANQWKDVCKFPEPFAWAWFWRSKTKRKLGLCLLHRNFLDKATTEYAEDPLKSPFGTSVIASYRSAWSAISIFAWMFERHPHSLGRVWNHQMAILTVTHALAMLVIRCPHLSFAEAALTQIDLAQKILRTVNATFKLEDAEASPDWKPCVSYN